MIEKGGHQNIDENPTILPILPKPHIRRDAFFTRV